MNFKKSFFLGIAFLPLLSGVSSAQATVSLATFNLEMLQNQMARQEKISRENSEKEIARQNKAHLEALRAERASERAAQEEETTTPKNNTATLLFSAPDTSVSTTTTTTTSAAADETQKTTTVTFTPAISIQTSQTVSDDADRGLENVDIERVRNTWLSWNNTLRSEMWLHAYTLRDELNATALEFSQFSKNRGYIMHGRGGSDWCAGAGNYGCYNFQAIDQWFQDRGINPEIINRSKHTENLGWGYYKCSQSDCTDALIQSIKTTYDFFYSEKSYNGSHYRSMTNPYFKWIGVDVVVDTSQHRYYLTIHYTNDF